jgi:hypothetical protein
MAVVPDWLRFDPCQNCRFFCPANGKGYFCSHPEIHDYLHGICKCKGRYFLQTRPWVRIGVIDATPAAANQPLDTTPADASDK